MPCNCEIKYLVNHFHCCFKNQTRLSEQTGIFVFMPNYTQYACKIIGKYKLNYQYIYACGKSLPL